MTPKHNSIEQAPNNDPKNNELAAPESWEDATERFSFVRQSINQTVKSALEDAYNNYREYIDEHLDEIRGDYKEQERVDNKYRQDKREAALQALEEVRDKLDRIFPSEHKPELYALVDALRSFYISEKTLSFKELETFTGEEVLTKEERVEQQEIRKDLAESLATIRWYVLSNENNKSSLAQFFYSLQGLARELGFKKEEEFLERGILGEVGTYKVLQRYLQNVRPATPEEDVRYGIDFWAETDDGTPIVFQAKSSSPFAESGIYTPEELAELVEQLEENVEKSTYDIDEAVEILQKNMSAEVSGLNIPLPINDLVRAKKLQEGFIGAIEYAKEKTGQTPKARLISLRPDLYFEMHTGNPRWGELSNVKETLEELSQG